MEVNMHCPSQLECDDSYPFRTVAEVLQLAEHAKLNVDDLIPVTQSLVFANNFGENENENRLLEVDSDLLSSIKEGDRIIIRGDEEDTSVLCTSNKTYEVREAETSNSLLIIPNLLLPEDLHTDSHTILKKQIINIHYKYLELKVCQPRYRKLLKILEENLYTGSSDNADDLTQSGNKWDDLLDRVQCSEDELLIGLKKFQAYQFGDLWLLLDFDYHFNVLSSFLNLIDSNSWPVHAINKEITMQMLNQLHPQHILDQCFNYYFISSEHTNNKGESLYEIRNDEVSRFCAEVLLKPAGKFNLHEFLNIWQQSVPEGVTTHLVQLKGIALVDTMSSPPVVWHFPTSKIPEDISEAFTYLFGTREKWTLDQIQPYLEAFTTEKTSVSSLLAKYSRSSMQNGIKYFTAKYSR